MKFADPYLLNLLWALVVVFAVMAAGIMRKKRILDRFASRPMQASILPGFDLNRHWIKAGLTVAALAFAVIALAGPQLGYRWEKTTRKGVDIMIALDCSKSMLARDIQPSRLERAKREMIDLLRMLHSDRAGLVAFAGNAFLQCPLTLDHEGFYLFLKVLEPGFLPVGGSNIDAAIQVCSDAFEKESDTKKAMIIITDGESTTGQAVKRAEEMAQAGIRIFTIGVGSPRGAPIPDAAGGFKKDSSGNIVLSRVDEAGLRQIAELTGGTYVRSVAGDMDLEKIYTEQILGKMERKSLDAGKKKVWENRFQWLLFPALILLLIEFLLPVHSKKKMLLLLAVFLFQPICQPPAEAASVYQHVKKGLDAFSLENYEAAKDHFIDAQLKSPENPALYYDIGAAAYKAGQYGQAVENFLNVLDSQDPDLAELKHKAGYNLGNSYYRLGKLDQALKTYETVLEEYPEDQQCRENLEFVKEKLKEQQQQQDQQDSDQKDQADSDQDKNKSGKDQDQNSRNQQDQEQNQDQQDQQGQQQNQDRQQRDPAQENQDSQKENENPSDTRQQGGAQDQPEPSRDENRSGTQNGQDQNEPDKQDQAQARQAVSGDKTQGAEKAGLSSQELKQMEQMLNRLEDQPGKALMPGGRNVEVEKDW